MLPGNTSSKGGGDVTIEVGAAQIRMTGHPPTVIIASKYQRRASKVIRVLREENSLVRNSDLANFLLHYFCSEALAKILQGAKENQPLSTSLGKRSSVHLNKLTAAMKHFGLTFESLALKRVFDTINVGVEKKSARKLRDAIVHGLAYRDVEHVRNRGKELIEDMAAFIATIEAATIEDRRF